MKLRSINLVAVATFSVLLLAGCASAPSQEQIASADYGAPMSAAQCQAVAEAQIASLLKDPRSAQFRNEAPCVKGWSGSSPILGMKAVFGYIQTGQVNGKNSFGGYVGFRKYEAIMKNGHVIRSCIADKDGACLLTNR